MASPIVLFAGTSRDLRRSLALRTAWPSIQRLVPGVRLLTTDGTELVGRALRRTGVGGALDELLGRSALVVLPAHAPRTSSVALRALALGRSVLGTEAGGIPLFAAGTVLLPEGDAEALEREVTRRLAPASDRASLVSAA